MDIFKGMRILLAGRLSQTQAVLSELIKSQGGAVVKGTSLDDSTSLVVVKDEASSSCACVLLCALQPSGAGCL